MAPTTPPGASWGGLEAEDAPASLSESENSVLGAMRSAEATAVTALECSGVRWREVRRGSDVNASVGLCGWEGSGVRPGPLLWPECRLLDCPRGCAW